MLIARTLLYTSKEKLFDELGWETIGDWAYILGLFLFHIIVKQGTRPLVRSRVPVFTGIIIRLLHPQNLGGIPPKCWGWSNLIIVYNLRSARTLKQYPFKGVKFSNSFYPLLTKKYNSLPPKTRQISIDDFKLEI